MKKIWWISLVAMVVLIFSGCEEEPTGPIDPPSRISVAVDPTDATGLGLIVSWIASPTEDTEDGIDGYYIYFNGELIDSTEPGECNYSFRPDGLGTISVTAYRGDEESEEVSYSTQTVDREGILLGGWETANESGIAWDRESGEYILYSARAEYAPEIDVVWDSRDQTLNSPDVMPEWSDLSGLRATAFAPDDGNGYPPDTGTAYVSVTIGDSYYVKIDGDYYLLLTVNSEDDYGNIHISYKFQKIQRYKRVY